MQAIRLHADGLKLEELPIPARLIGVKPPNQTRRDKLASTAVNGALSAVVCTPPYLLGRLGILMLGASGLIFALGILLLSVGVTLQAGATGSVRAIKMSATLTAARRPGGGAVRRR